MIELTDLKSFLNISADTSQDAFLQQCIADATGRIENYCNRKFKEAQYEEYSGVDIRLSQQTPGALAFHVKNLPVTEIIKIKIWHGFSYHECDILDSITITKYGILIPVSVLDTVTGITITYKGGYQTENMPSDLQYCAKVLAADSYYNSAQGDKRLGVSSRNWNSQVSEGATFKDVFEQVNKILNLYRVWNI